MSLNCMCCGDLLNIYLFSSFVLIPLWVLDWIVIMVSIQRVSWDVPCRVLWRKMDRMELYKQHVMLCICRNEWRRWSYSGAGISECLYICTLWILILILLYVEKCSVNQQTDLPLHLNTWVKLDLPTPRTVFNWVKKIGIISSVLWSYWPISLSVYY